MRAWTGVLLGLLIAAPLAHAQRDLVERELTDEGLLNLCREHSRLDIRSITISESPKLQALGSLSLLKGLRSVKLVDVGVSDLARLSSLAKLESLTISKAPRLKAWRFSHKGLRRLEIDGLPLTALEKLKSLPMLEQLTLSGMDALALDGLAEASALRKLTLRRLGASAPLTAAGLLPLTGLEELTLDAAKTEPGFLAKLAALSALQRLRLRASPIDGLSALLASCPLRLLVCDQPVSAGALLVASKLLKCELDLRGGDARFDPKALEALVRHPRLKWLRLLGPGVTPATLKAFAASKVLTRLDVEGSEGISDAALAELREALQANPRFLVKRTEPAHRVEVTVPGDRVQYRPPTLVVGVHGDVALLKASGTYRPPVEAVAVGLKTGEILWRKTLDPHGACRLAGAYAVLGIAGTRVTSLVRLADGEVVARVAGAMVNDDKQLLMLEQGQVTAFDLARGKVIWKRPRKTLAWPASNPTAVRSGQAIWLGKSKLTSFDIKRRRERWSVSAPREKQSYVDTFRPQAGHWVLTDDALLVLADRKFHREFDGERVGYTQVHAVALRAGQLYSKPLQDDPGMKGVRARYLTTRGTLVVASFQGKDTQQADIYRYEFFDDRLRPKGAIPWSPFRGLVRCGRLHVVLTEPGDQSGLMICTIKGKSVRRERRDRMLPHRSEQTQHPRLTIEPSSAVCRVIGDRGRELIGLPLKMSDKSEAPRFRCPPELQTSAYFTTTACSDEIIYLDERGLLVIDPKTMTVAMEYAHDGGLLGQAVRAGKRWLIMDTRGRLTVLAPGSGATITGR